MNNLFPPYKKPCNICPTIRCLESRKVESDIVSGLPGSNTEWVELFCYPIIDLDTDKITGIVEFVRDITERKRADIELAKYRDHLEELVNERTDKLQSANEKLSNYNELFVGREFRIKDLRDKIKEMEMKIKEISK